MDVGGLDMSATALLPVAPALLPVAPALLPVAPALLPVATALLPVAPAPLPVAPAPLPVATALLPVATALLPVATALLPVAPAKAGVQECSRKTIGFIAFNPAALDPRFRGGDGKRCRGDVKSGSLQLETGLETGTGPGLLLNEDFCSLVVEGEDFAMGVHHRCMT